MTQTTPPKLTIIIPSLDGYREGCVPRLLESVEKQQYTDYAVHLVKGVCPQGKAINQGVAETESEFILILDDDSTLADESVFGRLVEAMESDPTIGFAGASIVLAPDASAFEKKAALQFPRFHTPVVDCITDSDLACHGCCLMRRSVFLEVGGEREDILRGLDPDLRVRLREAGYRVVLVPHARIYHPLPATLGKLIRIFFRNGYGSAYAQKYHPDSVYETHESLNEASFQAKTSLPYRILRFPLRLIKAFATGQSLRFAAYCSYALGYGWGMITAKKMTPS